MKFKYGFFYKKYFFGWHKGDLYRLPKVGKYTIAFKKLDKIKIGKSKKKGYLVAHDRKTIDQLKALTTVINKEVPDVPKSDDLPF